MTLAPPAAAPRTAAPVAPLRPPGVPPAPRALPAWPVYALFGGFPLWWVLGIGSFAVVVLAFPMALLLAVRGRIRVPRHFLPWLVFVAFMLASAVQVDSSLRLIGFGMRAGNYLGATVVFVYLVNTAPERLPTRRVVHAVLAYWGFVVAGGYLGLVVPLGRLTTPLAHVLPGAVLSNEYVTSLVLPPFAEVQQPYGAAAPFVRPSAPFAYTNGWGCAYALMLPVVLLAVQQARAGWRRRALLAALAVSLVPAFATLNRGMFLAVGVAMAYVAVRLAARGNVRVLAAVLALTVGGLVLAGTLGVQSKISDRTSVSGSNDTRLAVYTEAFTRTTRSPVLGYGAPRPSEQLDVSVGTQGQVWNVMFSFGFIALGCFVAWFWSSAWRSRACRDPTTLWLHVTLVVASFTIFYYGYDGMQLTVVMVASALLSRRPERLQPRWGAR